ncbi:MAG TPA: anti-sigma factor [Candidatus Acidoferrum sp.]|nr:anti-sigma factor [Candidatus Acidoferrum sp.]
MNCAECRENLVAFVERLLDREEALACRTHLHTCPDCRAEFKTITGLQQRLVARGQAATNVSIVEPVMRRVRQTQSQPERNTIMSMLMKHRWGLGLGATAGAAAVALTTLLGTPKIQAAAVEVMTKGAQAAARLTSIHLRGQLRTAPAENFSNINPDCEFCAIELWKKFEPQLQWRVEKPGRIAVMDGQSTLLFIKPDEAIKFPQPSSSAFDTQWLHEMADLNKTLENELAAIKTHGWPVTLTHEQGTDGKPKSVITIEARSGLLAGDYLKNKFFATADTRRVYTFDDLTERLESARIYLHAASGDTLVFELDQIDYNQTIDPGVFQIQLPADVVWAGQMQMLPDNEKYAAMTSEQAARALLEACGREDWTEAAKFFDPLTAREKQNLGGLSVISVGTHFTSALSLLSGAEFVPYEIKLKNGSIVKFNLSLKRDGRTHRWFVDGGI